MEGGRAGRRLPAGLSWASFEEKAKDYGMGERESGGSGQRGEGVPFGGGNVLWEGFVGVVWSCIQINR